MRRGRREEMLVTPASRPSWLELSVGDAAVMVSIPHSGTDIPASIEARLVDRWLARKDTDWWLESLYDFVPALGVTRLRTRLSRTVIDANRDPSGASLYPGQATTELCPSTTFDGEPLYRAHAPVAADEVDERRREFFDPYHRTLAEALERLRARHERVVLLEAHSIRSRVPRLFEGELPHLNLGTNSGRSCAPELADRLARVCGASGFTHVVDGRFKGGWTTRHYGQPAKGVHAVQLEIACRAYVDEPMQPLTVANWPPPYEAGCAAPLRQTLERLLRTCIEYCSERAPQSH
jgi:N-formylglutamate deformylase